VQFDFSPGFLWRANVPNHPPQITFDIY
jgi:hypothetical protein